MRLVFASIALVAAAPLIAAPAVQDMPGSHDVSAVEGGSYEVDGNHSYVTWTVNHMGFTPLTGQIGGTSGTLMLDPANPEAAQVDVTFDLTAISHPVDAFLRHLKSDDFFAVEQHPTARFVSTEVDVNGTQATITGNLTIKGITRPVTLEAEFFGAGVNPMSEKRNIGFTGTTTINRSDFGLGYATPVVSDEVKLAIDAAFVKS